jgi:hypothetical protein
MTFIADTSRQSISGVGDYSLLLAAKVEHISGATTSVFSIREQEQGNPYNATTEVKAFNPDWSSFQFVPYAYASRGLVTPLTLPWKRLKGRVGTHFMFHEIWTGAHYGATLRERMVGFLQRRGIQAVVRAVRPQVVHSSNLLYSAMLRGAGIENSVLPLFGNIPIILSGFDPYDEVVSGLCPGSRRQDWTVAAFFGSIYPSEKILLALTWLQNLCQRQQRRLLVVSLGHCPSAESSFGTWARTLPASGRPHFLVKGPLESDVLSGWIGAADCGLATTPLNIIEKSGSAVAFAEHGIPVIVMDAGAPVRGLSLSQTDLAPDFWLFGDERLLQMEDLQPRRAPRSRLDQVARQFMKDLENTSC